MSLGVLPSLILPEAVLTVTAFLVLAADVLWLRRWPGLTRSRGAAVLASLGCVVAVACCAHLAAQGTQSYPPGVGMVVVDPLGSLVQQLLLGLALFTALVTAESRFTDHVGEYFALLLLATVGMMFLAGTENILMIFVSLELVSLSLYAMTAFNKREARSAEAALKYFLFGGMSAALLLFGFSLLYGVTGTLNLTQMPAKLRMTPLDPLAVVAMIMVLAGFGFKVAAVPFHLWAPDAYQGAPTPAAAFIASGSKVASFYALARVMWVGLQPAAGSGVWQALAQGWAPIVAILAVWSILLGNLAALAQSSVRRLLAYSAVAHAGYLLLAVLASPRDGFPCLVYYVATYAVTTLGAFAVVGMVQDQTGEENLGAFAGLRHRAPWLSFCLLVFLLSLAGIPPLAGFFGKFYVFSAALRAPGNLGLLWLVILAVGLSAVSLYYYLQVLKQVFVIEAAPGAPAVSASVLGQVYVGLLAAGVVLLGVAPALLLDRLSAALQRSGF
jgi:NADH-quinone oxidoreductase subunit N